MPVLDRKCWLLPEPVGHGADCGHADCGYEVGKMSVLAFLINLIVSGFQWAGPRELSHLTSAACMLETQPFEGFNIAATESDTLKSEDQFATIDLNSSNYVFKDSGTHSGWLPPSP